MVHLVKKIELWRYLVALLGVAVAVAVRVALISIIGTNTAYLTAFPAVVMIAAFLGTGPAIFASSFAILFFEIWMFEPFGMFKFESAIFVRALAVLATAGITGYIVEQLKQSRKSAIQASAAKSAFLANMSHELRTPLTAIMGFSELLADPNLSEKERQQFVKTICRNGKLLTQLIDDILDLSKIEAQKLAIETMLCSFPELIAEVVSTLEISAKEKGLYFRMISQTSVPEMIETDPFRFKQVLFNIIGNAIKFTQTGGVEVILEAPQESLQTTKLSILVKDTGVGIAASQQNQLFQPFMQADPSTTRRYGGTGLGLILSRRLAQALGGSVDLISSETGVGTVFRISIATARTIGSFQFIQSDETYCRDASQNFWKLKIN